METGIDSYGEKELLQRISEGDETAFKRLFHQFRNRLFGYILSITRSHHQAEEITQELFIKLWKSHELLAQVDNIDNYLFVMARLRTISYLRTVLKEEKGLQQVWAGLPARSGESPEHRLIEAEYAKVLQGAIENLSAQRKAVFLLSREEGLSLEEISERMGLSRNTVKNHLVEALKQLKTTLAEHGIGALLLFTILHG